MAEQILVIDLPLPVTVVAELGFLITARWPGAVLVDAPGRGQRCMAIRIDDELEAPPEVAAVIDGVREGILG